MAGEAQARLDAALKATQVHRGNLPGPAPSGLLAQPPGMAAGSMAV